MGGYGSTRWGWHTKRICVEDCQKLDMTFLSRHGYVSGKGKSGYVEWKRGNEVTASIGVATSLNGTPYLRLTYSITNRETGHKQDFDYKIPLVTTTCFGRKLRYWFICPLAVNGRPCGRRVGTLYLPPGGKYFGCRHCYNLTYRKAQEHDKALDRFRHMTAEELLAFAHELLEKERGPHKPSKALKNLWLSYKLIMAAEKRFWRLIPGSRDWLLRGEQNNL
ncbi:MAG: hypothetical protein ACUVSK_11295 [Desulfotomaculales bacterium]